MTPEISVVFSDVEIFEFDIVHTAIDLVRMLFCVILIDKDMTFYP